MELQEILNKLTLKEKIEICSGADFWHTKDLSRFGLPAIMVADGPHGLRCQKGESDMLGINKSVPATCFPTAVTTACSWDPVLLKEIGQAIGEEAKANGVSVVLGPGANIKRDPLCGRNFEYFSEDPYLAGKLAAAWIQGSESAGIGTSLKHFALNNQEYKRFNGDSLVDERTMREIYLTPFEIAVKEGHPSTVMCSYNKINGVHSSDNQWLLTDLLRNEWGFDGLVVTDWGAMNDRIAGMKAGCDLMMPGGSDYMEADLETAVQNGTLSEADIDQCVLRILRLMAEYPAKEAAYDTDSHHALAKKAAMESAVLLKNDGILPISEKASIAVIGHMAEQPRYQGAGSSHINPTRLSCVRDTLGGIYAAGCNADGSTTDELIAQAVDAAKAAEIALVFVGLPNAYESEGFDRTDMKMPEGHLQLIDAVTAANPDTVVILACGSPVECPWADNVKAILYMGLAGQASGEAVSDLLYGRVNPCGKLAESWPYVYEDCVTSAYYRGQKNPQYREGLYVGYRYYDKIKKQVRWPFGYGLSYTDFAYSDLRIEKETVSVTVSNVGNRAGAEIVQLYISAPLSGPYRPEKELKGFHKISLYPGESKTIKFTLNERSFALWDEDWVVPGGDYTVWVGGNSQDLSVSGIIHVDGTDVSAPEWQRGSWYEDPVESVTQTQWETMYGKAPEEEILKKGSFTMDHTVVEMKPYSLLMKLMHWGVETYVSSGFGWKKDYSNPEFRMLMSSSADSPLRNMHSSGGMKGGALQGLLHMANGHFVKGFLTMCGIQKK